jgi:hypothetical protein
MILASVVPPFSLKLLIYRTLRYGAIAHHTAHYDSGTFCG